MSLETIAQTFNVFIAAVLLGSRLLLFLRSPVKGQNEFAKNRITCKLMCIFFIFKSFSNSSLELYLLVNKDLFLHKELLFAKMFVMLITQTDRISV
jgi:hypothetical protein